MKLSKKQEEIIKTDKSKVIVNCAAASGKTMCLTKRLEYLINNYPNSSIVAITFTNAAAEEIKKRLPKLTNNIFIGTIHSYCNYLLLSHGILTNYIIENDNFDELFKLFKENNIKKENDYLLLDEGQDSTPLEIQFLLEDLTFKNWMIFSDMRQSIYGFRGADSSYIIKLLNNKEVYSYELNENYRNGKNILNYASGLTLNDKLPYAYRDNSICCSKRDGSVQKHLLDYDWIVETIRIYDDYKDWFILTRSNIQLDKMKDELEKRNIPCVTFKQADFNKEQLSEIMNSNTVKILTIHSSKGLENKNVMIQGMLFWNKDEICCSYVAATRAKDRLYILTSPKKKKTKIINWE